MSLPSETGAEGRLNSIGYYRKSQKASEDEKEGCDFLTEHTQLLARCTCEGKCTESMDEGVESAQGSPGRAN